MKPDNKTGGLWLYALGLFPVIWLALLIAPSLSGGLSEILEALPAAMNHPFQIVWCEDSGKAVLIFMAAYGLGIGIYLSSRRTYRRGEEHGSAKWGDPRAVNKKYRDKDPFQNRIFTQHVRMGLDGKKAPQDVKHPGLRRQRRGKEPLLRKSEPLPGQYLFLHPGL